MKDFKFRLGSNEEIYKDFSEVSTETWKRRLKFDDIYLRIENKILMKHIFEYLRNIKTKFGWHKDMQKDLEQTSNIVMVHFLQHFQCNAKTIFMCKRHQKGREWNYCLNIIISLRLGTQNFLWVKT